MIAYNDLRPEDDFKKRDYEVVFPMMTKTEKKRTISNLLVLKRGLDARIAPRRAGENLIVASWNIKEFGHTTQRLPESYFYITEILSCFDLIAIQEIKSSLDDLNIVMRLLGNDWGYLVNDITEGDAGNSERSCYIFNKQRVNLAGLAGEIVLWNEVTQHSTIKQLKRTPYITGFTAGWKTFALVNLHLHPGDGTGNAGLRREEVSLLLQALEKKRSEGHLWSENLILVGDFNLYDTDDDAPTIAMINHAGYGEVESLIGVNTNASRTQAYDRMFLTRNEYFTLGQSPTGLENGGVFNPFDFLFQPGGESPYRHFMKGHYTGEKDIGDLDVQNRYFKHPWRKNQISDHFPIWLELITDSSSVFLELKLQAFS